MKQSKFLSLNWRDFLMGWIMAIGTPIIYVVQELIPSWDIDPIYKVAISASLTYLIKNFFTSSEKPKTNTEAQSIIGGSTPPVEKDEK